jgi:hypothetical protein
MSRLYLEKMKNHFFFTHLFLSLNFYKIIFFGKTKCSRHDKYETDNYDK